MPQQISRKSGIGLQPRRDGSHFGVPTPCRCLGIDSESRPRQTGTYSWDRILLAPLRSTGKEFSGRALLAGQFRHQRYRRFGMLPIRGNNPVLFQVLDRLFDSLLSKQNDAELVMGF